MSRAKAAGGIALSLLSAFGIAVATWIFLAGSKVQEQNQMRTELTQVHIEMAEARAQRAEDHDAFIRTDANVQIMMRQFNIPPITGKVRP